MSPIRRYLRITKYSVLEVRIYLENPALAHTWLLNPRDPVLPKVIESVRPLVLPKLREERERSRKKSTKKKAIKDVVVEDDFEVAIFLTETNTRHSILYKHKHARDKTQTRLRSNSKKLTGGGEGSSREAAIDLGGDDDKADVDGEGDAAGIELIQTADGDEIPILRREDSDGSDGADPISLHDIPEAPESGLGEGATAARGTKRRRRQPARSGAVALDDVSDDNEDSSVRAPGNGDGDYVVVGSEDENDSQDGDDSQAEDATRPPKRARAGGGEKEGEKKKKVALDVSYEGFAIYGRVLCLVIKRRGNAPSSGARSAAATSSASGKAPATSTTLRRGVAAGGGGGQARMENWIASTQIMPEAEQAEEG
ncbi:hypothetical protein MAPG_01709 [Magnaporthiopsis poae ATCC 64411]|uniref:Uncharacterized protein n=1 Tax=Magnaporthiopsis poae (strain ATCC 64411 / 73-15) TaxID=644358 RepID=A0A0C4DPE5_MAGP6|nr:hypothetical protein MAPG_01709 [Magnaporthiopsis poae ATCC 64411]